MTIERALIVAATAFGFIGLVHAQEDLDPKRAVQS